MAQQPIKALTIVGGGTAGWISAALLSRTLGPSVAITVVESDEIGIVGVGEATIPAIRLLNSLLGLDENDFLAATHGTIKLGIDFVDWHTVGQSYLHAFGPIGRPLGMAPFHHYWLRRRQAGHDESLWDYSLNARAAKAGRFDRIPQVGGGYLEGLAYAFHFDAALYAQYLRRYSEAQGVTRVEGRIVGVDQDAESGFVTSLTLQDGRKVGGEFFIDCSGFRGLLIEEALKSGYEDWRAWLPMDSAIAVPCASVTPLTPYTRATAREAGWQWRIPLQHRTGNGHVFCSDYIDAARATDVLMANLDGAPLAEPRQLRFTTGRRKQFWNRNVVAMGLASGFMEPLESTSIHLVQSALNRLLALFPDRGFNPIEIAEYNRQTALEYEYIRDFLVLHYKATTREDTPFWRAVRQMDMPDSLKARIALFSQSGRLFNQDDDLFKEASWIQVLIGQGVIPQAFHPLTGVVTDAQLDEYLANLRQIMSRAIDALPAHGDFIAKNCPSRPARA
ncbi:tryptophan halogenase family protein [Caulobacter vibrioides]|uniref:Tryptophan halogenase, putative n=2 Tax=Caulobacter vibrioides TaxID=155892 RepID=Q9A607_CAUVC|nr:tryptophan halogenase family protein [Caulobacter vibrioides]YP_002517744.2 tryptophan halogenase superfamily protein [Caulobacter vibrioides NA1000]AAK24259.1 tryptophan halogenase, putative [Caulobacter vibrioides CB15]ACL95836.2 tryptophan halogenase superfamily protein [Caulobacter vibrioides NA1000]ATC30670.1 tryptophan 7-halogenase [Caulobacter vibrioides]QXZ53985.1 tryptophan 7-halogenase [Caulobacter vibrioides]